MKVAIVGFGRGWSRALSLREQGFEVWGFNDLRPQFGPAQADRWFQLHAEDYLSKHWPPWKKHRKAWQKYWTKGGLTPLYMQEAPSNMPGAKAFPKALIEASLPNGWYHCGSFDWLVAYALLEHAEAIHVYGVSLSFNGEPISSRACLEFWLGVAMGRGVEVKVESPDIFWTFNLMRSHWQYAWDESRPIVDMVDMIDGIAAWVQKEEAKSND